MDHEVGPWKLAFSNGPTSMVRSLKTSLYKVFGPLARCKTKCGLREMTMQCPKRVDLNKIKFDLSLSLSL